MKYQNRTVWITGASSGIGEALARNLAAQGARLVLSGRRTDALDALAQDLDGESLVLPFEATDFSALPSAVTTAWDWRDGVHLLINNAGVSQRSLAIDTEFDVYRRLMEIDYFAPMRLTQLILPRLIEQGHGQLAVVSSVAGKVGVPLLSGYSAAKHACVGYFDALRAEVELAYNIQVSVILPGSVRTNVAVNALGADGSARGRSDANIDAGMSPDVAATIIVDGLTAGLREIPVAQGAELMALTLRATAPETLFAVTAQEGARLAEARNGGVAVVDPGRRDAGDQT